MSYNLDSSTDNSKVIHINSVDADTYLSGTTSYFMMFLREHIKCFGNQRLLVSLHSATIPYSFYNIRDGINDTIPYKVDGGSTTITTLKIDAGNYTINSLKLELEAKINTILTGGISISYERKTQKFKYNCVNEEARTFTLHFQDSDSSCHIEMGFNNNDNFTFTNTPTICNNVVDVNGSIHGLFIRTNLSSTGSIDSKTKGLSTILGRIPIESNFGSVLFFNPNNSSHKILIHNTEIHTLTIKLTDEFGRIVDLNGLNYTIAIQVDYIKLEVYRPIKQKIRYIKNIKLDNSDDNKPYHTKKQKNKVKFLK